MYLNDILLIHIPRCAGTTFETSLGFKDHGTKPAPGTQEYGSRRDILMGWDKEMGMLQHLSVREINKFQLIEEHKIKAKVSIVRNPYFRAFSLYRYTKDRWDSFGHFIDEIYNKRTQLNEKNYFFRSQYDYLVNDKETLENIFIMKFENLVDDLIKFNHFYNLSIKIPYNKKQIKSNAVDFIDSIEKQDTIDKINEIYDKDFKYFNYEKMKTNKSRKERKAKFLVTINDEETINLGDYIDG